jgi:nucleotide-binding universal stress UspA family protein
LDGRDFVKILLAIDDSSFSEQAIQAVAGQTRPQESEVLIFNVVDLLPVVAGSEFWVTAPDLGELRKTELKRSRAVVAKAAERLRAAGLQVSTQVEEGEPKNRILDVAAEWKADLIVLGSHGRKGFDRFLLGSVSEAVARHAHCSVQIVRGPSGK